MDLISVIVPIYKVEPYLETCIISLVNQTYKELEIILVDDGSPDKCGEICDKWAKIDSRISVIHKHNGGLSDARNSGIEIARGKYIAFVDSDDWIDLNYYEILHNQLLKSHASIAASGVVFSYKDHEDKQMYNQKAGIYTSEEALKTIQNNEGFLAVAWNKLYLKELFKEIRYPYGIIHEDEFVTYRVISNASKLVLCPDALYHYRQRDGSIMTEGNCEKEKYVLDAYLERIDLFKKRYPSLYLKDKYLFCLECIHIFKLARMQKNVMVMHDVINKRSKITFSAKEMLRLPIKAKIYVLYSKWSLKLISTLTL